MKIMSGQICDICGTPVKTGLFDLTARKVRDGVICADCAAKYADGGAAWEYKTVEQVRRGIAARQLAEQKAVELAQQAKQIERARKTAMAEFKAKRRPDAVVAFDDDAGKAAVKGVSTTDEEPRWHIFQTSDLQAAEVVEDATAIAVKVTASSESSPIFVPLWAGKSGASVAATVFFGPMGYFVSKAANESAAADRPAALTRAHVIVDALRAVMRSSAEAQAGALVGIQASMVDQISQLAALHDQGVLSDIEFAAAKAKLLGI